MTFGVHTGLQNTASPSCGRCGAASRHHGFEWISIWDHFYAADGTGNPLLPRGGGQPRRARGDHRARPVRQPRVLASATGTPRCWRTSMATLDQLSDGASRSGSAAGGTRASTTRTASRSRPAGVRLRQVEEAIQCVRGLLTEERRRLRRRVLHAHRRAVRAEADAGARCRSGSAVGGEKVTLRIAARHADGWNVPFVSPDDYAHKVGVLEAHCADAGRDAGRRSRGRSTSASRCATSDLEAQFGNIAEFVRPGGAAPAARRRSSTGSASTRDAGAEW